ncbi:MAG: diacylglycerol kinase [Zetaproteobacteria bacterium CG_4_9_14_3_um_filter_53_7]|nr:MAG: diacylglycerol kinase [Zetaproteobacteria bacterium CG_4_9_14_3_um_filter_53_7]
MKKTTFWGTILLAGCLTLSISSLAWGDSRSDDGGSYGLWSQKGTALPVMNKAYQNECAACHFAYPASFLPARSWVKIMGTLENHFGENAELDAAGRQEIEQYLTAQAGDQAPGRFSRSFMRSIDSADTPLRISETAYFRREHREVPAGLVTGNAKVRSFANCASCHTGADKGSFNEHEIVVPGHGRWED